MNHKYVIDVWLAGTARHCAQLYLETDNSVTLFPVNYEIGTPARLEIGGNVAIEFEGEATLREAK